MQALNHTSGVFPSSRSCQPPRPAGLQAIRCVSVQSSVCTVASALSLRERARPRLLRSSKPLGHTVHRLPGTVARSTTAAEAEPATPLVSDNAAAEVPHAEVASQADLSAAIDKTRAGPDTNRHSQGQQRSSYQADRNSATGGRGGGKSRQPRTVSADQLVPGNEFDGVVVSIMTYGAFVDIGAETDGLVHISQLANEYVPDPSLIVHNKQPVRVRVQSFDPANKRLSLSMNLNGGSSNGRGDPAGNGTGQARQPRQGKVARSGGAAGGGSKRDSKPAPVKVGETVTKSPKNMTAWGAFFDMGEGFEGLLHVEEMNLPDGNRSPTAYDCIKEGQQYELHVLEVKGRKIRLTQKSAEQRQADQRMEQKGVGSQGSKKASGTMEAALAQLGFKSTPKNTGKKTEQQAVPSQAAEAGATEEAGTDNQSTVELGKKQQGEALERQISPKGEPTPLDLPPEAQKAAEDAKSGAALEGEESGEAGQGEPGTLDTSTSVEVTAPKDTPSADPTEVAEGEEPPAVKAELQGSSNSAALGKGQQDEALQRQINPKGEPTPVDLPPEAKKAAETPPEEGAPLEGESPDQSGKTDEPGTADESKGNTVEVTAPKEPEQAAPSEIAEGEESPLEKATNASASASPISAQASQVGEQSSAAALSGAEGADALPGTPSPATPASPAGSLASGSGESERTAPPAAAPHSTADSANQAAAGTSSSSAGGSGGSVSAVAVKEPGSVSAAAVKELRQETGAGMMDCKRALTEANGDIQKATEALRKKGLAAADKKAGRIAAEGLLAQYIHAGSRLGVVVEVNCETDFVARGDVFKQLANDMAMQIAACSQVTVVDTTQVPADVVEKERQVQLGKEDILKKPEQIRGKIVDGRIQKFLAEQSLLEQDFIKDTSKTVATVIKEATAAVGEKISIRRFERYQLGEGLEKKESDLGKDVEEQQAALQAKAAEKKEQEQPAPASSQIPDQPAVKVDAKLVKQLRDSSGAGMMDCKKALANNDNNIEKATEFLRKKGLAGADKKAGRVASEGAIASYVHAGSKLGVLIEVNCETDFVARGAKFKELVQDMAMQAAASPSAIVVALQDVPEAEIEKERAIEMGKEDIQNKPEAIRPKIVEGRLNKIRSQKALLEQPFIKDTGSTVAEHIKAAVASLGENIQIRRFTRYNLGEGIEKKQDDFAAEVAAQTGQ